MDSDGGLAAVLPIELEEHLSRISYAPESVKNGVVMPEAVSITDLETRGFSLDRDFVPRLVIEERIAIQMQKQPAVREQALVSRFQAGTVIELSAALPDAPDEPAPDSPEQLFELVVSPVAGDADQDPPVLANPAHCHLVSKRKRSKSILRKMRHDHLLPVLQNLISVDQFYSITAVSEGS